MTSTPLGGPDTTPDVRGRGHGYAAHPHKKVTLYFLATGLLALLIGVLIGPLQALNYAGVDVYSHLPFLKSYYQGLSLHGVLNALVFTTFFISGLLLYLPCRELGVRPNLIVAWGAYWTMTVGTALAAVPLLTNDATVLYTFYPPLMGHPLFYIGAAMLVAASLVVGIQTVTIWWGWKRRNPGRVTPIVTYMSVATWMMWFVASLGLVVEVLVFLIPWSLGITKGVDPLLARTLFWYTGHPIVYFWLLPAYVSWYALVPRQMGGRIVSEPLARLAFALFLLISTPVGFHHQYTDPGIPALWKVVHMLLTFLVAVPSLLTAFSVAASMEYAARLRGGRGWIRWMGRLPWKDAIFTGQALAMISFIFGGAGGIANASMAIDAVVHNTAWIPGHFHITVGTATTLTFFAVSFWLLPHLTGKKLASPRVALWSVWFWFAGMMVFALGMHWEGLLGIPRRAQISAAGPELQAVYHKAAVPMALTGISGMILLVGAVLYFGVIFATLLGRREAGAQEVPVPFSEQVAAAGKDGRVHAMTRVLENLWALFFVALALVAVMYGPELVAMLLNQHPVPGARLW
ncbi:b(o/a)3-type cytochrome-c oxidase subunit 1 [Deinococcus pimensis]|uniref:b(o/a)3-type cytochrome-c oxidase subunit 1 n=1 Tax=Deinococcus pimensis TaxID=309888 RepID=UPI0004884B15|nr:b(o/a)3-type cytochrome-c oxidase subunit 1 [Deinococcus pimensis]